MDSENLSGLGEAQPIKLSIHEYQLGPILLEYSSSVIPKEGLIHPDDQNEYCRFGSYKVNGIDQTLANIIFVVGKNLKPACADLDLKIVQGSHDYEIQLPWQIDTVSKLCIALHELGHAATLAGVGEVPTKPVALETLQKKRVVGENIQDVMNYLLFKSSPDLDKKSFAREVSSYYKSLKSWEMHSERLANGQMVRLARRLVGKDVDDYDQLENALLSVIAINHSSRFSKEQPYKQVGCATGDFLLKYADEKDVAIAEMLNYKRGDFDPNWNIISTHQIENGSVIPNTREVRNYAYLNNPDNSVFNDELKFAVQEDELKFDIGLIESGNKLIIYHNGEVEEFTIIDTGRQPWENSIGEKFRVFKIIDSTGYEIYIDAYDDGRIKADDLNEIVFDGVSEVGFKKLVIETVQMEESYKNVFDLYSIMYPPDDYIDK